MLHVFYFHELIVPSHEVLKPRASVQLLLSSLVIHEEDSPSFESNDVLNSRYYTVTAFALSP
jgi:DNA-directed RNA polymerase subunit H (RpoH/RPB5)